ncbi:hypothetical protein BDL97_13G109700 [Sphagnum fallax]|nr:hypothetical protein BDL97_13G109700 [Sphagnum fallax]KAH8944425.1 hypothetical protein BDL97_13G109700 [Sphagnum fallax]
MTTVAWDSARHYGAGGLTARKVLLTSSSTSPLAAPADFPPSLSPAAAFAEPDPNGAGSFLSRAFNTNVLIMMSVFVFAVFVIVVVSAVARCRTMRRVRLQQQLHPEQESQRQQQSHLHKGLEKDQIQALPVITFGAVNFPVEGYGSINDCVVCLSDYQKGEQVRLLPLCKHYFHVACIDTWLSTHISCPVCRHSVLEQQQQSPADNHHTTADPTSEADHQSSAAVEDSQDTGRRISRSSARFGTRNAMMIFGRARVASAIITSHHQHMDIDVEPGRTLDVAAGGAASTSDQSARWSFSAMFSKLASAIQSL